MTPEFDDMQRLLRFGNGHLREACFLLLGVKDAVAARQWLRSAPVSNAATQEARPEPALR